MICSYNDTNARVAVIQKLRWSEPIYLQPPLVTEKLALYKSRQRSVAKTEVSALTCTLYNVRPRVGNRGVVQLP